MPTPPPAVTVAWATFHRTWSVTRRAYPWSYFVGTLMLGVFTVGLAHLGLEAIGGGRVAASFAAATGTADYLGYITVGAAAFMFTTHGILWVAKALIQEQREGTLGALLVTPPGRLPYLAGFTAFAYTAIALEVTVLVACARVLGVRLESTGPPDALLAVLALGVAVFGMSAVLSAVMIIAGEAHITQNTLFFAIALLSGFTFPRQDLPAVLRWAGELVPTTAAMDVVRGAFTTGAGVSPGRLAAALGLGLAYAVAGLRWLPLAERHAMQRSY
ncbi:ABC transporter permease [Sphaerisporangium sp. TRM90804]|uniref:ABC transporter permease n=1 Tax=Sphaerisporangium sp. TRM90804 TaxID=3031113 RepID=UPI00244B419A|nr:ABC transporter permease [Sphaerisporangium sp. TRM90804]MDH2428083.1 ABC transporter permease [Sphaerisporangium sp. TRM90804]